MRSQADGAKIEDTNIGNAVSPELRVVLADAALLSQVFVPFFMTKQEGASVGLFLSHTIMTSHGGEIAVQSNTEGTNVSAVIRDSDNPAR